MTRSAANCFPWWEAVPEPELERRRRRAMVDRDFEAGLGAGTAHDAATADEVEARLWQSLEMDELSEKMSAESFPHGDPVFMGTGHTHNACYSCSNSATTAGCGTCNR